MIGNAYDNDITTWSPQGRLHQIEYAMEAVKQGTACPPPLPSSLCSLSAFISRPRPPPLYSVILGPLACLP